MVGRLVSLWESLSSGAMLVSGNVSHIKLEHSFTIGGFVRDYLHTKWNGQDVFPSQAVLLRVSLRWPCVFLVPLVTILIHPGNQPSKVQEAKVSHPLCGCPGVDGWSNEKLTQTGRSPQKQEGEGFQLWNWSWCVQVALGSCFRASWSTENCCFQKESWSNMVNGLFTCLCTWEQADSF